MTKPKGPADNVLALFAVLQQLWPNQFKHDVDQDDPAGVWKSNVGYFTQLQLESGLRALRVSDAKYMPNAPGCAAIIKEAIKQAGRRAQRNPEPEPSREPFWCAASQLWQSYSLRLMIGKGQDITGGMATLAAQESKRIAGEYGRTWDSEPNQSDEMFAALTENMSRPLIAAWNRVCKISLPIATRADLANIGFLKQY